MIVGFVVYIYIYMVVHIYMYMYILCVFDSSSVDILVLVLTLVCDAVDGNPLLCMCMPVLPEWVVVYFQCGNVCCWCVSKTLFNLALVV